MKIIIKKDSNDKSSVQIVPKIGSYNIYISKVSTKSSLKGGDLSGHTIFVGKFQVLYAFVTYSRIERKSNSSLPN